MTKQLLASSLCIAIAAASLNATAGEQKFTEAKQGGAFVSAAVLGAVAGGPVGFIVGAVAGAYVGEEIKKADEADTQIAKAQANVQTLEEELSVTQLALFESEQAAQEAITLTLNDLPNQIFFATNSDTLSGDAQAILTVMADVLDQEPNATIELTGHTDPRGTDEYNNVLSQYRAQAVKTKLLELGVDHQRIVISAHGSAFSTANKGDLEHYALERRVDMQLLTDRDVALSF